MQVHNMLEKLPKGGYKQGNLKLVSITRFTVEVIKHNGEVIKYKRVSE